MALLQQYRMYCIQKLHTYSNVMKVMETTEGKTGISIPLFLDHPLWNYAQCAHTASVRYDKLRVYHLILAQVYTTKLCKTPRGRSQQIFERTW